MNEYDKRKVSVKEVVNELTGEVVRHEKRFIQTIKQEEFIKFYLEDMSGLMRIKGDVEWKVLIWLYKFSGWNNGEVVLDISKKVLIAEYAGVKLQSISDALTRLVKKFILIKGARLYYKLNPEYFFKGEDIEREKVLKIHLEYNIEDNGK
jgi:hypothetical protein